MLKAAAGGKQQVTVFVKVVTAAEIEAGAIDAINSVSSLIPHSPDDALISATLTPIQI